jgi:STIP1 homology and U-box containing protein 1
VTKIKSPSVATYFTNRALCYIKLQKYNDAMTDTRRAIKLDAYLVKGHYFLGQALIESQLEENVNEAQGMFHGMRKQSI